MSTPTQISFEFYPTFNVSADLITAMRGAVLSCNLSREQIVDRMNDLAGRYGVVMVQGGGRLTLDTLEKWLNPNDTSRAIPVKALPVFCAVTKDKGPMDVIAKPLGFAVIGKEDAKLLAWAKASQKAKAIREELKRLEREIS